MAKKTKAVLKNDITTVIDDGGELTASELRTILDDTVDSAFFGDSSTGPQGPKGDKGDPGTDGNDGAQGAQGSYTVRIYARSTGTPAPTGVTWVPASGATAARLTNTGSPTTWSLSVPGNSASGALWEATATFDPASSATNITVWSSAFQAGSTGPAGPQGTKGDKGSQGSYTVRLYQRSTGTVTRPTLLTWTASTGALSGTHAVNWRTDIPQGDDPVWETNAVFDPSGSATTITSWGEPFRLTGPIGPAGPAGTGSGTGLSAANGRKLAEITEADGYAYTQVPNSELGGNTSQFSPAIMGITSSFSINIYVQVLSTLTLTDDIRFRHISSSGTVKTDVALSTLTLQSNPPAGKVRYRTASPVALVTGDTIRIFSRVSGKTYTLSSKYIVPAASVSGTLTGVKGDTGSQGAYLVRLYKRSSTAITAAPTDVTWTSPGTLSGTNAGEWSLTVPAGTASLYTVTASFNPASPAAISTWSNVIASSVASGAALTASNRFKLSNIADPVLDSYALVPDTTVSASGSGFPAGRHATLTNGNTRYSSVLFFAVVQESLTLTDSIRLVHRSADGDVKSNPILSSLRQVAASTGQNQYQAASAVALEPGDTVSVSTLTVGNPHLVLSSNYRIPVSGVTGLTSAGIKGPKGDTGSQGPRGPTGPVDGRLLRTINEVAERSSKSFSPVTGSQVALVLSSGGTPVFANSYTTTSNGAFELFIEIDANSDVRDLALVQTTPGTGFRTEIIRWSASQENVSSAGKFRYKSPLLIPRAAGSVYNLQRVTNNYQSYTLSDKYRVPPGDLYGINSSVRNTYTSVADSHVGGSGTALDGTNLALSYANTAFTATKKYPAFTVSVDLPSTVTVDRFIRLRHLASDGTVKSDEDLRDLSSLVSPAGRQRYMALNHRIVEIGDVLSLQNLSENPVYTMSSAYKLTASSLSGTIPASKITGLPGAVAPLSASNTRKLAEITEGAPGTQHVDLVGGQLAFRDGSSAGVFSNTLVSAADQPVTLLFEVPTGTSLSGLSIREYDTDGNRVAIFSVSSADRQASASAGKDRYRTTPYTPVAAGNTIRLRREMQVYGTYTMSSKYRLPVGGLVGSIPASSVSNTASGGLTSTNVQAALNELQSDIDAIPDAGGTFFDHVGFEGTLTNLTNATDFYYLVSSSLPRTTLSSWTHVTSGVFPQPALASVTNYVVLLPNGTQPNKITWDRDSTQPEPSAGGPDIATVPQSGFQRLRGDLVPDGYTAWRFRMPPWNNASSLRTGARIQVGDLLDTAISRIDLDPTIKVTDNNLDITSSITSLTELQQEKLQGLQLKTFSSDITTEGKPSSDYDVLMATAWPDPDVTYARGVAFASQQARYTGIVPNGRSTGYHDFFNLVSNTGVTLGKPTPEISSATSLSYLTASDGPGSCSGIFRGTIQAADHTTNSRMRIDDDEGLFAAMTLHTPSNLPNGTYPIMNIGNTNITGTKTLILHNAGPQYAGSGLSIRVREQTGSPTSTTAIQDVLEPLYDATSGNDVTLFHPPVNTTPITVPHDWVVPASYTIGTSTPVTYRLSVRVWNNGNDLGEHDFTSSLPDAMQKMANFTTAVAATTFTIPFGRVGFTGLGDETMRFTYTPVDATSDNRRIIELALVGISNPAFTYAVRLTAVVKRSVTTPAGPTRDIVLSTIPAGNTHEVGFYARSRDRGSSPRTMIYHVSVNGVDGTNGDDGGASTPPTGSVPVTFGPGTTSANNIAVNRFLIVKPKKVLTPTDMNNLTTPSLRNRVDVGGLVRHAGGTFHEVFSPAYKSVLLTNSKLQQLRHSNATNNSSTMTAATANFGTTTAPVAPTPVSVTWEAQILPPEFSVNTAGDEITAETNFTASLDLDVGVGFQTADIMAAEVNPKAYLLLEGLVQEKIGTADWKDVPGPKLYHDIRTQLLQGQHERPEVTSSQPYALIRRTFATVVHFKSGAKYRVRMQGYRLHSNSMGGYSGSRNWTGNVRTVVIEKGSTFMTMGITPTI